MTATAIARRKVHRSGRLAWALACCAFAASMLSACERATQPASAPSPSEVLADATGHYCGMLLLDHEGPKGQIHLASRDAPVWFSSVRDTIAFLRLPEEARDIAAVYVNDMARARNWAQPEAGAWVDARIAWFVIESARRGGMGAPEAIPFSERQAAERFRDRHGGRVVRLDDIPDTYVLGPVDLEKPAPADTTDQAHFADHDTHLRTPPSSDSSSAGSLDPTRSAVLVLGATGRFGAAAVQAFSDAGWRVIAHTTRADDARAGCGVPLDAAFRVAALASAARGARVVAYAINPPYTRWATEVMPLARTGIAVARTLRARFMIPGNVYNFGAQMPPLLREDTPQRPTSRKGRIRVELEGELAAHAADGLQSVVLRAGDFFGGGTGSWLDLVVLRSIHRGKLVYPGPTDVAHAWAYLPDFARAFVAVASRDALSPFSRLHFSGHTLTGEELLSAIERSANALGLRPARGWRRGSMPWPLVRAAGVFMPMMRELAEMAYLWRVPHALDGSALTRVVGPLETTPLDEAMRDTLRALGLGRHDG